MKSKTKSPTTSPGANALSTNANVNNIYLFLPKHSNIHMGVIYNVLMLIAGLFALFLPSPLCGWISLAFFVMRYVFITVSNNDHYLLYTSLSTPHLHPHSQSSLPPPQILLTTTPILSCLNQPLPLSWRYPLGNMLFPVMLLVLSYNINPDNNPLYYLIGGGK
jgi:hypothetical protein